jgi:hypothetical protein
MTYEISHKALNRLNRQYATIEMNGSFRVLRIEDGEIYSRQDFIHALEPLTENHGNQLLPIAPLWLAHKDHRHYPHGLDFDPSKPITIEFTQPGHPKRFNLWRGYAVQPQPGNVEPFLE